MAEHCRIAGPARIRVSALKTAVLRALVWSAVFALAGCYAGPGAEDPTFTRDQSVLPPGVLTPAADNSGVGASSGIYPSRRSDDPLCCWVGSKAWFEVRVPPHAHEMIVTTFVPENLDVFKRRHQSVTVEVDGGVAWHYVLRNGVSFLHVPVMNGDHARTADVVLEAGFTFTPRRERINGDTRDLSFYLKSVRFRTS